jgi:hypothetical protein
MEVCVCVGEETMNFMEVRKLSSQAARKRQIFHNKTHKSR